MKLSFKILLVLFLSSLAYAQDCNITGYLRNASLAPAVGCAFSLSIGGAWLYAVCLVLVSGVAYASSRSWSVAGVLAMFWTSGFYGNYPQPTYTILALGLGLGLGGMLLEIYTKK